MATAAFALLLLLIAVFGSWYTVDQRERAVVLRNGAVTEVTGPGLHFKWPFFESAVRISLETQLAAYPKMATYSRDQQPAEIKMSVNWRVAPGQVDALYSQYGNIDNLRERVIDPKVLEETKNVFGQYNAVTSIQDRARLNADIRTAITNAVRGPLVIENVQLENIDFSDAYENSVEQRMLAEVEVQKIRQNAEREKVSAEITVIKAKAMAEAQVASAEANAKSTRMQGEAEAAAIEARGRALRENAGLVQLQAVERWDGRLPVTMVPGSAVPFLGVK